MNASAKILLIDDDPGIRDTLCQVLTGEGHEVVMEQRGDSGLARAAREPFNVVITDLKLPGLDGLDLVRQLHDIQPRLPIILITAFGTTQTAIEATKLGAYDYLLKPFKMPQRLGGRETIPVDVRVLAATHHDLEVAIQQKSFREDLYYQLNVVVITLPPLRQRKEDIPELVRYFLGKYGPELGNAHPSVHDEAIAALQSHSWPGNVRELENAVRKALLLAQDYTIGADHVRAVLNRSDHLSGTDDRHFEEYVDDLLAAAQRGELTDVHGQVLEFTERELFRRAIELAHGNQAKAARWLGISRVTMKAKLVQFGFHPGTENDAAT